MRYDSTTDTMPWDVPAAVVARETAREAATRLGVDPERLRHRAKARGILGTSPLRGRPPAGMAVCLTPDEWNAAWAPRVVRFVSVGSLERETGSDWRTILAMAHRMGEAVHLHAKGQRAKYSLGAAAARRVVVALRAVQVQARRMVPLRRAAKVCGVHGDALARILAAHGVPTVAGPRRSRLVDLDAARRATLDHLARETLRAASARTGIPIDRLRRLLAKRGLVSEGRKKAWLDPAEVNAVVNAHRPQSVECAVENQ